MTTAQDSAIRKTLANINQSLTRLDKIATLSATKVEMTKNSLQQNAEQLKKQLEQFAENDFSYEFYHEGSDVVEKITQLRLKHQIRPLLKSNGMYEQFNEIVNSIRAAVYRHKSLTNQAQTFVEPVTPNSLEEARTTARSAAEKAAQAAADAEQANSIALKLIEKIQEERQTGKKVSQADMDQSFEQSLTIYAKNAAAVMALDAAAIALANLDEALKQAEKQSENDENH